MDFLTALTTCLFNWFFPITCLLCGSTGTDICSACSTEFTWPKYQKLKWVTSFWNYRDPRAEQVLRHIKTIPNIRIARFCAALFSERILNRPKHPEDWLIIPIPITRDRLRTRGFNQSIIIGTAMAQAFSLPFFTSVLVKNKNTRKQGTAKSSQERAQNITGSFSVINSSTIKGKNIILIDDIITTGSTLKEARHVLLTAGARRVIAWTLAN